MGSSYSRLGHSYNDIYLPADCLRQCHPDRCFCRGTPHRSRKWLYVERGGDGRESYRDPMVYMDSLMMGGGVGGMGGGWALPREWQGVENWRLKDFERLSQVVGEYLGRVGGVRGLGAGPAWMGGFGGLVADGMGGGGGGGGGGGVRYASQRRGRFAGDGSWEDEMMQRMKRMEEIARDYDDRIRGISDHLYGSSAERQEEIYKKRQRQMWQDFMQSGQMQSPMGMGGMGGLGGMGGMGSLGQAMQMGGMGGAGMNPMAMGGMGGGGMMGGMGGMMNPMAMGGMGGMGSGSPLMGAGALGGMDDRLESRRRVASRRRPFLRDDDDDDDDFGGGGGGRFGRRRRSRRFGDDDDLFGGRFGDGE